MRLNITSIDELVGIVSVAGDYTTPFTTGIKFLLFNDTFNAPSTGGDGDGLWTVVSSVVNGANTDITVAETIPTMFAATHVVTGIYEINFSDPTTTSFFVHPETVNGPGQPQQSTSLALNGKGSLNYGENLLENMVHIMEHFANASAPSLPTIGQIWFDTLASQFNFWNGSVWAPLVSIPTPTVPDELYDFAASTVGLPIAGGTVARFAVGRDCTIDLSLLGGSVALTEVPATADAIFSVELNGVQFGTITYATGSSSGTCSDVTQPCSAGDKLTIVAPAVADTSLSDLTFVIGAVINTLPPVLPV